MAVAIMFSGIAAVALPLAQEFGITREIDDRVMCPLPVAAVAIEKIVFSAVQSMIAAGVVFPLAYYMPATPVYAHVESWTFLIAVLLLASLTAGALGLVIGTSVRPQQIGLIFGVVVMPITFLGCVYYPWAALKSVKWLQVGVLINPIVYMSEGLRAALTPGLHHMNQRFILAMLSCSFAGAHLVRYPGIPSSRDRLSQANARRDNQARSKRRNSAPAFTGDGNGGFSLKLETIACLKCSSGNGDGAARNLKPSVAELEGVADGAASVELCG
jgi:hypothetical protein